MKLDLVYQQYRIEAGVTGVLTSAVLLGALQGPPTAAGYSRASSAVRERRASGWKPSAPTGSPG